MIVRYSLILSLVFIITSCKKSRYIPSKPDGLQHGFYLQYSEKLNEAYNIEDNFEVGIQLANLEAPKDKVFYYLNKGIKKTPNKCLKLYPPLGALRKLGIKVNIVKIDTTEFLNSIDLCLAISGEDSYNTYLKEDEKASQANRDELDSLLFDYTLIGQLQQIRNDDQDIILRMNDVDTDSPKYDSLANLKIIIDSINLNKVERIIKEHGWPSREKIGHDMSQTIWLVFQHQTDIFIREKNQELVEANSGAGNIEAYNYRSNYFRNSNKHKLD